MFYRHGQNITVGDVSPAISVNSLKYNGRFPFVGIFKEIGIHLAARNAVSDNIKSVANTTNLSLLPPIEVSVGSQSD